MLGLVPGIYRTAVTRWCVVVIAFWIAAATLLPMLVTGGGGSGELGGLLPAHSHALQVEKRVLRQFSVPVLSETSVVVYEPNGLSVLTRADVVAWAATYTQAYLDGSASTSRDHVLAAVPIPTRTGDTAVTYLYMTNGTSADETLRLARNYASHFHNQASVQTFVTGLSPAQARQAHYLQSRLDLFAVLSLALVCGIVGLVFRSLLAPAVVLAAAGAGYLVTQPIMNELSSTFGFAMPSELKPVTVALLLGVVTDYSVLLFSGMRDHVSAGADHGEAVRRTLRHKAGVVAVAGLTVAGGTIALLAADLNLFRAFGPALAITVLIGVAVSLSLTPALMTVFGRRLFRSADLTRHAEAARTGRVAGKLAAVVHAVTTKRGATWATIGGVTILLALAAPVLGLRLSVSLVYGLPHGDEVRQGAVLLSHASIRGVTAPTEIVIESDGVADRRAALDRLQSAVSSQPGVAEVLGAAQNPLPQRFGVVLARSGNAARLVVIFDSDPLGARAISDLHSLNQRLPRLTAESGLTDAQVDTTGLTAVALELTDATRGNLEITLLVALGVELAILMFYLRAVLASVVLLACSALVVLAALGLTTVVFQTLRGDPGVTFYGPFATAVLLLALGSDYNIFTVGTIWDEAHRRPFRQALRIAVPRSSRAVTVAGVILAATFAMVAIIPLETFRQIAFTMAAGLLIDTLFVRPLLTPAVLALLGRAGRWPGRRFRTDVGEGRSDPSAVGTGRVVELGDRR